MAMTRQGYHQTYSVVREVIVDDSEPREVVIASFLEEVLNQPYSEEDAVENLLGAHASVTALVDGYGLLAEMEH